MVGGSPLMSPAPSREHRAAVSGDVRVGKRRSALKVAEQILPERGRADIAPPSPAKSASLLKSLQTDARHLSAAGAHAFEPRRRRVLAKRQGKAGVTISDGACRATLDAKWCVQRALRFARLNFRPASGTLVEKTHWGHSRGATSMCDYSLQHLASRPAKVGDNLVTTRFGQGLTGGFCSVGDPRVAVCVQPGTELAFEREIESQAAFRLFPPRKLGASVARFRRVNEGVPHMHHDALELPGGQTVLLPPCAKVSTRR